MNSVNNISVPLNTSQFYRIQASLYYSNTSTPIYKDLEIRLPKDKFTCLLGESGCGKTSLLRQIAGLMMVRLLLSLL